ncbi:MAG: flagellar assembly protein FliW [Lentisphaeraceae bacterium]|nr:flagellar assembly protein FliW [Lentisphaeraceae bacterium]
MKKESIDFGTATAMEIRHGAQSSIVPLESEVIFTFENGLPAFEDCKEFIFVMEKQLEPFLVMQSLNQEDLSFVCIDPFIITDDYTVKINEGIMETLEVEDRHDILIMTVVTVDPDMTKTTANLVGPIILNMKTNKGMQVILDDINPEYVRYNVWDGATAQEEREDSCAG